MKNKKTRVCLFVRVSSLPQDYRRQIAELSDYCRSKDYSIEKIIATKISGTKKYNERPDLEELFQSANKREFDKVLVTEISRIGRNARDVRNTIDYLHERNISVLFKNLGGLESLDEKGEESLLSRLLISIFSEISQEEKKLLSERIRSGLTFARERGKILGRPSGTSMNKEDILKKYPRLANDLKNRMSLTTAMKVHGVSKGTIIKIKKVVNAQLIK